MIQETSEALAKRSTDLLKKNVKEDPKYDPKKDPENDDPLEIGE
jgi:hypothetical protein